VAGILVIHELDHVRRGLLDAVQRAGYRACAAADLEQARAAVTGGHVDGSIVVAGAVRLRLRDTLGAIKSEWPAARIIAVGESGDIASATAAIRDGAYDYVPGPTDLAALHAVLHAVSGATAARSDRRPTDPPDRGDAVIVDAAMRTVYECADRAALVNSTVLITGESGTGKEVLARHIHRRSRRCDRPFVPVNCGGLTETLIESELFGYRKGAFTGAAATTRGLIEEAEGGVLFLDEIGDMPISLQVRLLRFLDNGEIRRVGDTAVRHVDVRVVAATHRCLTDEIRRGRFREDLFFRLNVVALRLPPLRTLERAITPLAQHHAARAAERLGVPVPELSEAALHILRRHRWPGNVRELQNALEYAVVQRPGGVVTPADLPEAIVVAVLGTALTGSTGNGHDAGHGELVQVLEQHHGNHAKAASALGISRTTLWRRLRQFRTDQQLNVASMARGPETDAWNPAGRPGVAES
jgi:DNA-binding NtrC family response regulator